MASCWFCLSARRATISKASLTMKSYFADVSKKGMSLLDLAHDSAFAFPILDKSLSYFTFISLIDLIRQ